MVHSDHKSVQLEGVVGIRRFLSNDQNPPIKNVIDSGIVPKLLEFMIQEDEPKFQYESAWAITNICSGESQHVKYIISLGGLEIIINLLDCNSEEVVDQGIWAIGNITGDSVKFRDTCLELNCLEKMLDALNRFPDSNSILRNTVWAASNLTRGKPFPDWDKVSVLLPILHQCIASVHSTEVLSDALWCLSYISDMKIQEVIDQGCVPYLVSHLFDPNLSIVTPALRALGNLVTGDDAQTNEVLSCPEFLPRVFELTSSPRKTLRKEAFWTISNITAGNPEQIEAVLQNPTFVQVLKNSVLKDVPEVATEASWAINNMISGATSEQLGRIVTEYSLLECFHSILQNPKPNIKSHCLDAAYKILKAGQEEEINIYFEYFDELNLVEEIKGLVECKVSGSKAKRVLEFFKEKEDNENGTASEPNSSDGRED